MSSPIGLSQAEALNKGLEIIMRDAERIKAEKLELKLQDELEGFLVCYEMCDPDLVFNKISSIESNQTLLKDDLYFMIKIFQMQIIIHNDHPERQLHYADIIRNNYLFEKYQLKIFTMFDINLGGSFPIMMAFPDIGFNVRSENPSLCPSLPDALKKYTNFRKEYSVTFLSLLPAGKKFGGFVKALIHYGKKNDKEEDGPIKKYENVLISYLRTLYNSKIYSHEERLKRFEKFGIKENDCALWTELFDKQYPHYKNIHKIFGQVA